MLEYEKKEEAKRKQKEKKRSREIIQPKYMNPSTGQLQFPPPADRPPETRVITEAKRRAADMQNNLPLADRLNGFTAHHKYPWSSIRNDIELAFMTIPKTPAAEKTLRRLEGFSNNTFPVTYDDFVKDANHRNGLYRKNEPAVDAWIQNACWTPSNIFIGPLSNQREDDPEHRHPVEQIDAHYISRRRMSDVSEATARMFAAGGLQGNEVVPYPTGRVSAYQPREWKKDVMAPNTQYYQTEDTYYRDNIFHYQVISNIPYNDANYQFPTFTFSIETLDDVARVKLRYNKKNYGDGSESKILKKPSVGVPTTPNKKRWDFTITIAGGFIYNKFEFAMVKDTGKPKIIKIQSIFIKK